ncbi:MAG: deoxyribodipyrimidine photo-lyase [Gammaproteobacteria bacterium]|nr:deoxyribodipyrimidine photo-lyase [Gammaproteobacteria bacterium]NIR97339.1 deoxyribodipyrimidine photo-lyase [Gammaproteobacteria bacterium]NIT63382.1 deoxyribodipyrimidine photo-lyase [Gammaproteobacteria bacterium]NIV20309.1 deoxyribodipyrimidine photo-lyase [Gammaproteobacteria bacterium]NIX10726.1 deoxyribodipyrimidine photo-lyase [Gammaproteobacteria bacterium]
MDCIIVWFRNDLRLADHPALRHALRRDASIVPVFVHAPEEHEPWTTGAASRWWLHHSLVALDEALRRRGSRLTLRAGPSSATELHGLARETGANAVLWNRRYEPALQRRDTAVHRALRAQGIETRDFPGALLFEPWAVATASGGPYRVFTPFWRNCGRQGVDQRTLPMPRRLSAPTRWPRSLAVGELGLLPRHNWVAGLHAAWRPGEDGAHRALAAFCDAGLADYGERRDLPGAAGTSRLSPHLHFGELTPRQVARGVQESPAAQHSGRSVDQYLRALGWREFAYHVLHHFPETPQRPLDTRFEGFPWRRSRRLLAAWQHGATGYPIIDAGMRELWHTGWMHNRVRMLVASLLTKNCRIAWQHGARWFWDTLVDADLASNTLNWQWVAGCGADAAPYFRIFNPVLQGQRFDPDGDYVRRWVPELAGLPNTWLHRPWTAPQRTLGAAGVRLGRDYPKPAVGLQATREQALALYRERVRPARGTRRQ